MVEPFPAIPDLAECLRQLMAQVPAGRVTTCGDLAEALGNRIAATWIGYFALHHEHGAACPCHRILRAGGALGPFIAGTSEEKSRLLRGEGIEIRQGTVDLERFGFRGFSLDCGACGRDCAFSGPSKKSISESLGATAGLSSSAVKNARNFTAGQASSGTLFQQAAQPPLILLREVQEDIQAKIVLRPRRRIPKLVGGVDVSYPAPETGSAAYALVETAAGRLVWSTTVRRRVAFPYISTYLGFREIPILLELLDAVRAAGRMAEVLLVDGSGVLHHRRAGVASHLGVVAGLPTVGVTKKLLCGEVDIEGMAPGESRPVVHRQQLLGVALRPTAGSRQPIFISPGHRTDLEFSEKLVRRMLTGRRLPEPLHWADRLSRANGQ